MKKTTQEAFEDAYAAMKDFGVKLEEVVFPTVRKMNGVLTLFEKVKVFDSKSRFIGKGRSNFKKQ